jgi:hypothetical protein
MSFICWKGLLMRPTLLRLALGLAGALALPIAVSAQDLAAEYVAAARVFAIPGETANAQDAVDEALIRAQAVTGTWFPASIIVGSFGDTDDLFIVAETAERMPEHCGNFRYLVTQTGPRSFESRLFNKDGDTGFATRFQYVGGRSYQLSMDEDAMLTRYGIEASETPPYIYAPLAHAGVVEVFLPSANVMVVQAAAAGADIYLRCPGS